MAILNPLDTRFAQGMGPDIMSMYETEEERRRRLEREALDRMEPVAGPVAPPAADLGPVKQTITFDPRTGDQKMKVEGPVQAFSPEQTTTPTLTMPGQPVAGPMAPPGPPTPTPTEITEPAVTPVIPQQTQIAQAPVATMTDAVAPVMPDQQAQQTQPMLGQGLRVPGFEAPSAEQTARSAQATAAQAQAQPGLNYPNILMAAGQDPNALMRVSQQAGGNWGRVYAETAQEQLAAQKARSTGEAQGEQAANTGRGVDRIMRRDPEPNTVGFYAKQYLMRRLGLQKEADAQLAKTTFSFQTVTDSDGKAYTIKTRGDGLLLAGYDADGSELDSRKLAEVGSLASMTKDGTPVAERVRDSQGTEWSRVNTKQGPIFFGNDRRRGVPVGRTTPITGSTDLEVAQGRQDIETQGAFTRMTAQARLDAFDNTNKMRADRGLPQVTLEQMGLNPDGTLIGERQRRSGTTTGAAEDQQRDQREQVVSAAAPQRPAQQAAAAGTTTGAAAPMQGRPVQQAAPPVVTPVAPTRPVANARIPTANEMDQASKEQESRRKVREAGEVKAAEMVAEDRTKLALNQAENESRVDAAVDDVRALLDPKREGRAFESAVGATWTPGLRFIDGTPQASWFKKFEMVKGGQFLTAVKQMKGMGALSDREGQAATQAISALSASQNEQDFRRAANDYMDIITRGIDRDRAKLGQPPRYSTPEQTERTRQDNEALLFIQQNPNDPRAEGVRQRLRQRGLL